MFLPGINGSLCVCERASSCKMVIEGKRERERGREGGREGGREREGEREGRERDSLPENADGFHIDITITAT